MEQKVSPKLVLNILQPNQLIDNTWTVERIITERAPFEWEKVFHNSRDELKDISEILENDKKVNCQWYPDNANLFKAFELTPLTNVKVVLIGQDPYQDLLRDGTPQAQGLSFSVKKGAPIPPSLRNIYKEIKKDYPEFIIPTHGDLSGLARQGILLLNSCLTVRHKSPGCHKELWLGFIKKVINAILDANPKVIFLLWGNRAQKVRKMLGERATVLETSHPSPLSVYRGFQGCQHFKQVNDLLIEQGMEPINWQV